MHLYKLESTRDKDDAVTCAENLNARQRLVGRCTRRSTF